MRDACKLFTPLDRSYGEHSAVRRYCVDSGSLYRQSNVDTFLQDPSDAPKIYVVARRNCFPHQKPFFAPNFSWNHLERVNFFDVNEGVPREVFDSGISSDEDGGFFDSGVAPSKGRDAACITVSRLSESRDSNAETPEDFLQTSYVGRQIETDGASGLYCEPSAIDSQISVSPEPEITVLSSNSGVKTFDKNFSGSRPRKKSKLSDRAVSRSVSPTGLSPSASFGVIYNGNLGSPNFGATSSDPGHNPTEGKGNSVSGSALVSLGTENSQVPIKNRSGTLSTVTNTFKPAGSRPLRLRQLDKGPPAEGSKATLNRAGEAAMHINRIKDAGVLADHVDESTEAVPIQDGAYERDGTFGIPIQDQTEGPEMDYMDSYFEDSTKNNSKMETISSRRKAVQVRNSISSAALLNSWYIAYGSENSKNNIDLSQLKEYSKRNSRYPSRSRLPPTQHWTSNLVPNGSSIVFLIGVTADERNLQNHALNASGDIVRLHGQSGVVDSIPGASKTAHEVIPDSSLVIMENRGNLEMQIIEDEGLETAIGERSQLAIYQSDPLERRKHIPRRIATPTYHRISKDETGTKKGKSRNSRINSSVIDTQKIKPAGKRRRGSLEKYKSAVLSAEDALDILKNAPTLFFQDGAIESDGNSEISNLTSKIRRVSTKKKPAKPAIDNAKETSTAITNNHPEAGTESSTITSDSMVEQDDKSISYKSVYRPEDVESVFYDGINFKPMIMNTQCRTSNVIIPKNCNLDFGNVKSNFICGFIYAGNDIMIKGLGTQQQIREKHLFFLPTYSEWSIHNNSRISDARMVVSFVNV